jgi:MFS family permease
MTTIATSWLIYRLTGSAFLLATLNAVSMLPSFLLSPYAGVQVDRWPRHKVLLCTQTASMLQSFILAILTLSGIITVPELFILVGIQGIVNAFDLPARQAFVSEVVESKKDLANAIALNSGLFNGARLVGPAIGGVIIAATNEGVCFLIDGISYLAVILALLAMHIKAAHAKTPRRSLFLELKEGLLYSFKFEPIFALILIVGITSFSLTPLSVLMPVFAKEVFRGGPQTLGLLMASSGCGALIGAIYLASRESVIGLGKVITYAGMTLGSTLIVFSFTSFLLVAVLLQLIIGVSMILMMASSNTLIQTLVDPTKRGRVMSLFGMAFTGMMPLGSLFAGWSSEILGLQFTVSLGGLIVLIASVIFAKRLPHIRAKARPILIERGILTEPLMNS